MPLHVGSMRWLQLDTSPVGQAEYADGIGRQGAADSHDAIVMHRDQPGIEGGIQVGREQQAELVTMEQNCPGYKERS